MKKKEVIKIKKLDKGETFIKVTSPHMNPHSTNALESPYDRVRWCAKALSRDQMRQTLQCLYIDETYIVATDGNRLHITWNEYGYSPGLYHVLLCNSKQIILERDADLELKDYPKFQGVIPYEGCSNGIEPYLSRDDKSLKKDELSRMLYHVYMGTGNCYNMTFLEDVTVLGSVHEFQTASHSKQKILIVGVEDCNRIAIIMPFRI